MRALGLGPLDVPLVSVPHGYSRMKRRSLMLRQRPPGFLLEIYIYIYTYTHTDTQTHIYIYIYVRATFLYNVICSGGSR